MKTVARIFNKLSVKIIGSIVILVTLLTGMIAVFSYQIFMKTTIKEITTYITQVADFAFSPITDTGLFISHLIPAAPARSMA